MLLSGKRALIMGLANERSVAWGVAKQFKEAGAEIGLTYITAVEKRVRPLAEELGATLVAECDVAKDEDLKKLGAEVENRWAEGCDVLVHSIAFADREDLAKPFRECSREGFQLALDVSAYSFVACVNHLWPSLSKKGASVMAMTYLGSEKVVQNYNVMGVAKAALESSVRYLAAECGEAKVRVNALSPGPIRTLAASGIKDFKGILTQIEEKAPLRRNIDTDDVGKSALYLASDLSSGVTGEVIYVDSGYNILAL